MTADATLPASDDLTPEVLARWEVLAAKASGGPWRWWNLEGEEGDQGWSDNGPNLETVARGPVYSDGSQGAAETIISAWGHDAWGIGVENADAEFIAESRTAVPALLSGVRSRDARIAELEARAAEAEAVIAKVRDGWMDVDLGHVEFGRLVFELLEATPSQILARVKAEAKAEALEEAASDAGRAHSLSLSAAAVTDPGSPPEGSIYMPNVQPWLLDRAAAYRAGATNG